MSVERGLWDATAERALLRQRLESLAFERLLTYAIACVTHAKDALLDSLDGGCDEEYLPSARLLNAFWAEYPQGTHGDRLESFMDRAEQIVAEQLGTEPDERFLESPAAERLLWGTLYAISLKRCTTAIDGAYCAAEAAYSAALYFFGAVEGIHDQRSLRLIEDATARSRQEIEFQLALLKVVESAVDSLPSYSSLLQQIDELP